MIVGPLVHGRLGSWLSRDWVRHDACSRLFDWSCSKAHASSKHSVIHFAS
jgi:hypothetical protein